MFYTKDILQGSSSGKKVEFKETKPYIFWQIKDNVKKSPMLIKALYLVNPAKDES